MKGSVYERFLAKLHVRGPDDCWIWHGAIGSGGYGNLNVAGKAEKATRLAWMFEHGEDPRPLWVLHRCDVKSCCNPRHLFLGTRQDNIDDMISKGRQRPCKGEMNGVSRLTESQVRSIRAAVASGVSTRDVAQAYGVGDGHVRHLITRRAWRHLDA